MSFFDKIEDVTIVDMIVMNWCQKCSLRVDGSTGRRQRWQSFLMICCLRQMSDCACSISLLPLIPSITSSYYSSLSDSSVCVALRWRGSGVSVSQNTLCHVQGHVSSILYTVC